MAVAKAVWAAGNCPTFSDLFHPLPPALIESLYYWLVRSGLLLVKVHTLKDDSVVLGEHCHFLAGVLGLVLQPGLRHLQQDLAIDLRNFPNFPEVAGAGEAGEVELELLGLQSIEEPLVEQRGVELVGQQLAGWLESGQAGLLQTFRPGLLVRDRGRPGLQPVTLSLAFTTPRVLIALVRSCPALTSLDLTGYQDLSDIVLLFISGEHEVRPAPRPGRRSTCRTRLGCRCCSGSPCRSGASSRRPGCSHCCNTSSFSTRCNSQVSGSGRAPQPHASG